MPAPQVQAAGLASPPGLPSWLPAAWLPAGRIGLTALAIGLAAQYAFGAVMVLIQMLSGIGVDWGASLRAPLTVFLSLHGPVDGLGLWATGTGWILLAFWLAGRHLRAGSGRPASLQPALVLAARSAFVYMVPVLVLALLFNPEQLPIDLTVGVAGAFFDPTAYGGWSPWLVATLGLLAALFGAVFSIAGAGALPVITRRLPPAVTAGLVGARALLSTAIPGVLGVVVIGVFVEVMIDGVGLALGAAYLLTLLLAAVAWGGLDVSVAFIVFAMRFFGGDGLVVLGDRPAWVFVCVAIVALAYARGGYRAAQVRGAAPLAQTVLAAASAGVLAAFVFLIAAGLGTGTAPGLAGPAFGLGLLWSAVAVLGGLWQAGVRPRAPRAGQTVPAPPPTQ